MREVRLILSVFLAVSASLSLFSCGGTDLGADLTMVINPTKSFLLPGTSSSCLDYANAQVSGIAPTASVTENRLSFPSFSLSWNSTTRLLYIAYLRVVLRNPGISGGVFEQRISGPDLDSILGIPSGAAFNGTLIPNFSATTKTISTGSARTYSASTPALVFPACSFTVGGIGVTNAQRGFAGSGRIELVGFSVTADGGQAPVRKFIDIQYEYVGSQ